MMGALPYFLQDGHLPTLGAAGGGKASRHLSRAGTIQVI
jgi:hypothetical protein